MGDPDEVPAPGFGLAQLCHCDHLQNEQWVRRSLSLSLSFKSIYLKHRDLEGERITQKSQLI